MTICVGNTSLQRFLPEHTDLLYDLSNRPEVRKGMSKSAEIPYESHVSWVKENLIEGNNVHLFLVIKENQALGAALIKNITQDSAELGIIVGDSIAAERMFLTSKLLAGILFYTFYEMKLQYLNIRILLENSKSIATAKKIGAAFQVQDETYNHFLLEKTKYENFPLNKLLLKRYQPFMHSNLNG
ncbi:GNAT family N-acetyltransferase [Taibaiella lutea]|uniref:GNAT family N-acetyltransferase n=1 Tax=Taibaiella lutea TaxID=2608001 RepID=A0A5M6CF81_9BACT|nr:GNAT family N-acetyltransferase [Taibaiella lutea]KAA5533707.1 GNAT family N-acetyltransferase [Taibaiella lutea]